MSAFERAPVAPVRSPCLPCLPYLIVASALVSTLVLGACGGGQKAMTTEQAGQRHQEIQALWAEIERMEQGGPDADGGDTGDTRAGSEPASDDSGDSGDIEAMSVATTARPADASRPEPLSIASRRRDQCHQSQDDRAPRCADVCRLAESICDNADRICHLAGELGDDAWASDRCAAANASCTRADARCCGCDA